MTKNPAQPVPTKLLPIVISSEFANFAVDMEKGDKLDKKFYKIRDVAEMLGLAQSTLRYWEQEFPQLRPRRNDGGTRFYTPDDIELLRIISFMCATRECVFRLCAISSLPAAARPNAGRWLWRACAESVIVSSSCSTVCRNAVSTL